MQLRLLNGSLGMEMIEKDCVWSKFCELRVDRIQIFSRSLSTEDVGDLPWSTSLVPS